MRKLSILLGMAVVAVLAMSSSAAASSTTCNGTLVGQTISGDLVVPADGVCIIDNTTVGGDVKVGKGGYFQSTNNSKIGDDVQGRGALVVFIDSGTTVGDDVEVTDTPQALVFDSTIGGHIEISRSSEQVNICGNTVDGRVQVRNSERDILIGDPLTVGCGGNTVLNGHRIRVEDNSVDKELTIRGNDIQGGDLEVNDNSGAAGKAVENNKGGYALECRGNETPFTASGNTGWDRKEGQCASRPEVCNDPNPQIGVTFTDDVVVPEDGVCILSGGSIGGDVKVGRNAYFQATGTSIAGDVEGRKALTLFIDTGTTVGGGVESAGSFQVFVFGATLKDELEVSRSTDKVQVCGSDITGDVEVDHSGRDILFGDTAPGADCAANTIRGGHSAEFEDNSTDVEFTIRGNVFDGGDLTVDDNHGPSDKFVQDNTGGDVLECHGNATPFTGTPNSFATEQGQCAEV
jgi:hypothetical protein